MAIGMMSVRVGRKGKALPHCQYIAKLDKFAKDTKRPIKKPQPTDMAVISTVTRAPCSKSGKLSAINPQLKLIISPII